MSSSEPIARRQLLQAVGGKVLLPAAWVSPVLAITLLPEHAYASSASPAPPAATVAPDAGGAMVPDAGSGTVCPSATASSEGVIALASQDGGKVSFTVTVPAELRSPASQLAVVREAPPLPGPCPIPYRVVAFVAPSTAAFSATTTVSAVLPSGTHNVRLLWSLLGSDKISMSTVSVTVP